MHKMIEFDDSARAKIAKGVGTLAKAVKVTLGPRGRNVVIQHPHGTPHITKDGVTVARAVLPLEDTFENIGATLVKEVASKTADIAGDGTTTATVLAESILEEGLKLIAAKHHPMALKRGIDKATAEVITSLKSQSKEVSDNKEIMQVATISANGDESIGAMIASAMEQVGKDGVVTLEEGSRGESSLRVSSGFEFDRGYLSPYFCNEIERQRVVLDNPLIWVINTALSGTNTVHDMSPILEHCSKNGRPIVVIAENIENDVLATLVTNTLRGVLKCVAIKAPGFGDRRAEMLEDIGILTGAHLRKVDQGEHLVQDTALEELGEAKRVVVTKDKTVIVANEGKEEEIEKRVTQVRASIAQEEDSWTKERLQQRLAKLLGGVAVIEVGAATEVEMKEKKDRIEDALSATKAAVEEGIVPGGGLAFLRAYQSLESFSTGNTAEDAGVKLLRDALLSPMYQIVDNAGKNGETVVNEALSKESLTTGYDAAAEEFKDMFEAGIVDPTKVVRAALQNATSIAGLLLTTECTIAIHEDKVPQAAHPGAGMMM